MVQCNVDHATEISLATSQSITTQRPPRRTFNAEPEKHEFRPHRTLDTEDMLG
jgi:hypothetical protein